MKKFKIHEIREMIFERIDSRLMLHCEEETYNDIFDIVMFGIKRKVTDASFWNQEISDEDKLGASAMNIVYHLTGGDKAWKSNMIWNCKWHLVFELFQAEFNVSFNSLLNTSKTLEELKNKIMSKFSVETFYDFGMKHNIINTN